MRDTAAIISTFKPMKPTKQSIQVTFSWLTLWSLGFVVQILIGCNANHTDRPVTLTGKTGQTKRVDKEIMNGFDTARWYYYYFNAVYERKELLPLENYSVHPTLYSLDFLNYQKKSDTLWYFIRKSFKSTKIRCINIQDSIEVYMTEGRNHVFSIKEHGTDMDVEISLDLDEFRNNKILSRKIDSFLLINGRQVHPWFQKEARLRGFEISGYYNR
jgi:hypothetical protein